MRLDLRILHYLAQVDYEVFVHIFVWHAKKENIEMIEIREVLQKSGYFS